MKFRKSIITLILVLLMLVVCARPRSRKMKIAVTTMMLHSLVHEIGADKIDIVTIVPAGMCPGHFDITAENIISLSESRMLISHGWENWTDKLLASVDNKPSLRPVGVSGNLMVPDNHIVGADHILSLLCSLDVSNCDFYIETHGHYIEMIDSVSKEIKVQATNIKGAMVICSDLQKEFIKWLELDVIATYPRAEELTPMILAQVISRAEKNRVAIVIDNLQSGPDAGKAIAKQIGAKHIVLTNFPLEAPYPETLMENFLTIKQALE